MYSIGIDDLTEKKEYIDLLHKSNIFNAETLRMLFYDFVNQ
jgi:hypothetical protein